MKPENKIPVLDRISDEMKSVVNFHRDDLPPWPAADDFVAQRQHYIHERQLWNADAPRDEYPRMRYFYRMRPRGHTYLLTAAS